MLCETCGGCLYTNNEATESCGIPCSCVLQFQIPDEGSLAGEYELLYLQNRQNQLQKKFAELKEMLRFKDSKFSNNNGAGNVLMDEAGKTLTSSHRRTYSKIPKRLERASPNLRPAQTLRPTPNSNEDGELNQAAKFAPERASVDECDLLKIREEIGQLRRQIEGGLQSMQNILQDNLRPDNKMPVLSQIKDESKENSMPKSILTSAQQDFLDAVRHRQMLEAELAASERAQARRDIFDILDNADDGDIDVLRMRALLDDAVCNIDASRRLKDSSFEKPKPVSRIDRLSAPKKQAQAKPKAQQPRPQRRPTTSAQRPQSLRPTAKETEPPVRWPTGLADICSSSLAAETRKKAAPLMKRPKVVLPPPAAPQARSVHFEETSRSQPAVSGKGGDAVTRKKTARFVPLGMRQYSMWYPDNQPASAPPHPPSVHGDERITQVLSKLASSIQQSETASKLTGDDIRAMLETIVSDRLAEKQSQPQRPPQRDANVCTSRAVSVEKSLSPILSPRKLAFTDAASSPKPAPELMSRGQSVQSTAQALQRSFSLPSVTSEAVTAEATRSAHTGQAVETVVSYASSVVNDAANNLRIVRRECQADETVISDEISTDVEVVSSVCSGKFDEDCLQTDIASTDTSRTHTPIETIITASCAAISLKERRETAELSTSNKDEVCPGTWDLSTIVTDIKVSRPPAMTNNCPHSPILAANEYEEEEEAAAADVSVTTEVTLATASTQVEDLAESGTSSLTEPRSFSDGVWLDPDRSEGEACGLPSLGEAAQLVARLGQLPSSSEVSDSPTALSDERKSRSEGEFTVDLIKQQPGNWIPPWRDPLLHLVASNTAAKNARLHWSQAHEVEQIAAELAARSARGGGGGRTPDSASSGLDVSGLSTPMGSSQSEGEVDLLAARRRKLRRAILSRSSQRMRQREVSLSDDEVTLTETVENVEAAVAAVDGEVSASETTDHSSVMKDLSADEDGAGADRTFQLSNDDEAVATAASDSVTSVSETEEPL